jgi:hypothetical protein
VEARIGRRQVEGAVENQRGVKGEVKEKNRT